MQQGYKQDQLVVLTPYLAQLREIRLALAAVTKTFISSMDMQELIAAGEPTSISNNDNKGIRVATIDNYQGEESDVVIASLVRSNKERDVGFIGDPNRVNVMLSRARHGMVLVGNLECLENARARKSQTLWKEVSKQLQLKRAIYQHFPAKCNNHSTLQSLQTPEDFQKLTPDGGCTLPCGANLSCGHKCPRKCHNLNPSHAGIKCREKTRMTCPQGHSQIQVCSEPPPICSTCQKVAVMKAKEEARIREEELKHLKEQEAAELHFQEAKLELQRKENELAQTISRIKKEEEAKRMRIEAERLEKENSIKMREETEMQEQQLAELERKTKQQLFDLQQETSAQVEQANKTVVSVPHTSSEAVQVDVLLGLGHALDTTKVDIIRACLSSLPKTELTRVADFLFPKIGIAAFDWTSIAQNLASRSERDNTKTQLKLGWDNLTKGEWLKGRTFFEARKKGEMDGGQTLESDLALLICASQLKLGDDPQELLDQLVLADQQFPPSSNSSSPLEEKAKENKASKPPWGLRSLAFAAVYDLLAQAKSKAPSITPSFEVEAAAHSLSFLAFPVHWKKHLEGRLEKLATTIFFKYAKSLSHSVNGKVFYYDCRMLVACFKLLQLASSSCQRTGASFFC